MALPEWQFNRISKYSVTKRSRPTGEIEPFFVFVFLSEMNSFNYVFSTHSVDPSIHPKHTANSSNFFLSIIIGCDTGKEHGVLCLK